MTALSSTLAATVLMLGAANAGAETDIGSATARYAVAKITNPLSRTVTYRYRWGDRAWKTVSIAPGVTMRHSWRYQFPGQNKSPKLVVRFDADVGEGVFMRTYTLKKYAVQFRTIGGKRYRLGYSVFDRVLKLSSAY